MATLLRIHIRYRESNVESFMGLFEDPKSVDILVCAWYRYNISSAPSCDGKNLASKILAEPPTPILIVNQKSSFVDAPKTGKP